MGTADVHVLHRLYIDSYPIKLQYRLLCYWSSWYQQVSVSGEKRLLIYLLFTSCKSDIALNFTNLRNTFGTWFSRRVSNDFAKFCSYYNQVCVKRNKCYFSKTGIISNRCWDIFGCKLSLILRYYQQWGSTCVCLKREILRVLVAACVCSRGLDRGLGK